MNEDVQETPEDWEFGPDDTVVRNENGEWEVLQPPDFACPVCSGSARETYKVLDEVWAAAGFVEGHVHLHCLQARLGRQITIDDFDPLPECNRPIFFIANNQTSH